jgi:hypothetical protein
MTEPDPRLRLASAQDALRLLAPADVEGVAVELAPARPKTAVAQYLRDLAARLEGAGFAVQGGGALGGTPLELSAYEPAEGLSQPAIRMLVARAERLEGAVADHPLAPVPCALFAHAAATAPCEPPALWRALLGQRVLLVPLVVSSHGIGPRTLGHLAATLREPDSIHVVPAIVDLGAGVVEIVTPRSLVNQDPHRLVAAVRRLVDLP